MATKDTNDYRVSLIELADQIARSGLPDQRPMGIGGYEDSYLERFRAAYWHLVTTVDTQVGLRSGDLKVPAAKRDK